MHNTIFCIYYQFNTEIVETIYKLSEEENIRLQCEAREDYYRRQRDAQILRERQEQKMQEQERQIREREQQIREREQQIRELKTEKKELSVQNRQLISEIERLRAERAE